MADVGYIRKRSGRAELERWTKAHGYDHHSTSKASIANTAGSLVRAGFYSVKEDSA